MENVRGLFKDWKREELEMMAEFLVISSAYYYKKYNEKK